MKKKSHIDTRNIWHKASVEFDSSASMIMMELEDVEGEEKALYKISLKLIE
jgi:hypothetical protein